MSDELVTEHRFTLTQPFEYALKGDTEEATFVLLTAPTSRHIKAGAPLVQAFYRAVGELQDKQGGERTGDAKEQDPTADDLIQILAMSSKVDLADVLSNGRALLTGGVALVDGEVKMTGAHFDRMLYRDSQRMVAQYLLTFLLASETPTKE